jgi:hypothetical protein
MTMSPVERVWQAISLRLWWPVGDGDDTEVLGLNLVGGNSSDL